MLCLPSASPECPGLGVVCSKALWAPREQCLSVSTLGVSSSSRVDFCCDRGAAGGLLLPDSDLSAPLFYSRGKLGRGGGGVDWIPGQVAVGQEPRPLGWFLLCQGIASRPGVHPGEEWGQWLQLGRILF